MGKMLSYTGSIQETVPLQQINEHQLPFELEHKFHVSKTRCNIQSIWFRLYRNLGYEGKYRKQVFGIHDVEVPRAKTL